MKERVMSEERLRIIEEDLARVEPMKDEDIDLTDMPEMTDEQWSRAVRGKFYRPVKQQVTLRLDADVIAWFRRNEAKYQTAINAALREHVARQRQHRAS